MANRGIHQSWWATLTFLLVASALVFVPAAQPAADATPPVGADKLNDNGGPTPTHGFLAGSPAIDAANTAVCPATDQRGVPRDAACDVGAFEVVP